MNNPLIALQIDFITVFTLLWHVILTLKSYFTCFYAEFCAKLPFSNPSFNSFNHNL